MYNSNEKPLKVERTIVEGIVMKPAIRETLLDMKAGERRDIEKWRLSENAIRATISKLTKEGVGRWGLTCVPGDRLLHIERLE